ncbi:MAG: hypothetical protein J7J44_02860 [Deltaproteobacteria bacterium]|nr:hypothetical protein [Deltaproteobacteria bacterium]
MKRKKESVTILKIFIVSFLFFWIIAVLGVMSYSFYLFMYGEKHILQEPNVSIAAFEFTVNIIAIFFVVILYLKEVYRIAK